jgi:cytochrome c-type biogenesis protein CcmH/NrfG
MTTRATYTVALFTFALALFACACGKDATNVNGQAVATSSASPQSNAASSAANVNDMAKLDADVEQLEKRAERNPGDDEALSELAKAYIRRGDAHRAANQLSEALFDYRRAQSADPDNADAQRDAAEISPLVEGAQTGENGEPAPLPITPGVTADEDKPTPTPTPTQKKQ